MLGLARRSRSLVRERLCGAGNLSDQRPPPPLAPVYREGGTFCRDTIAVGFRCADDCQLDLWRCFRRLCHGQTLADISSVGNAVLGCHAFRATGITVYLLNGGLLEYAQ